MKRLATAAVLIPLVTYVALWGPSWLLYTVIAAVALVCFGEYLGIAAAYGLERPGPFGYAAGLVVLFVPRGDVLLLTLVAVAALSLATRARDLRTGLPGASLLVFGVIYAFGPWRSAVALHAASPYWLFLALSLNWIGDTAAFCAGKTLGRHKLAPELSPGKTWEGAIASLAVSMAFGFLYLKWLLPQVPLFAAFAVAGAGNLAGQIGDLAESLMKRGAGVKDSGNFLPGHGGWLDRLDSTLFALPVIHSLIVVFGWAR